LIEASCERRCQSCQKDFVVIGRLRRNRSLTPAIESIACPYCKDVRRAMLSSDVEGPIRAAYTLEEWGEGQPLQRPLDDEDLDDLEAGDLPALIEEVRRLRAENSALAVENEKLLERLRNQS
jgi:hypothetical protein